MAVSLMEDMADISAIGQEEIPAVEFPPFWRDNPLMPNSLQTNAKEILRARLQEAVDKSGIAPRRISEDIGANHSYVAQILSGKGGMPSAGKLDAIAMALGTTTDWLVGRTDNPAQVRSEVSLVDMRRDWIVPPREGPGIPLVGTGDCADLDVMTDEGVIAVERSSFDPQHHVTYIKRPTVLSGDDTAYAIYFHGSSMENRFFAGEVGIVQPSRPAGPGDFVVVQITNGHGPDVVSVMVKRLIRQTANYVELEQFNPPAIFRIDRKQVARIHRIMSPTELLMGR